MFEEGDLGLDPMYLFLCFPIPFNRPGAPMGAPARKAGTWTYTREYEHASVFVDLTNRTTPSCCSIATSLSTLTNIWGSFSYRLQLHVPIYGVASVTDFSYTYYHYRRCCIKITVNNTDGDQADDRVRPYRGGSRHGEPS